MRPRRAKRARSYAVEAYDPDSSGPEADPAPRRREEAAAEDAADADFDAAAAQEEDDDDYDGLEGPADASEARAQARAEAPAPGAAPPRRRVKKPSFRALMARRAAAAGPPAYRPLEPAPSDSHAARGYVGPYFRNLRGQSLIRLWYGHRPGAVRTVQRLLDRWVRWPVLPPKRLPAWDVGGDGGDGEGDGAREDAPPWPGRRDVWRPADAVPREARAAARWRADAAATAAAAGAPASRFLAAAAAAPWRLPDQPLAVLVGPYPAQRVVALRPGDALCLSQAGLPVHDAGDAAPDEARVPIGWMLDAGGIVVGMDWAPRDPPPAHGPDAPPPTQLLALAVVPRADHESYDYDAEHRWPGFQLHGLVQIWALDADHRAAAAAAALAPSERCPPALRRRLCFDGGRARRVRWSPAGEHLAVLCGDGRVCVVAVGDEDTGGAYEQVQHPIASLALIDQDDVKATCIAWATFNRLVVGYSDGSLALWSVHPAHLLARHPVHHSDVVDVATGAPALPYLAASAPIGGSVKLVDMRSPACETTEVQVNTVNWQPNMLAWSDHLLGFLAAYPSANALNTVIGFVHHAHFPVVRRVFTGQCFLTCLAVGRTHPYLLIGASDGSLWSLNPQCELFKPRRPPQDRIRLFQHEHRPPDLMPRDSPAPARGASRVLHGFAVEKNLHGTPEGKTPKKKAKRGRKKGKKNDGGDDDEEADDDEADEPGGGDNEPGSLVDPTRGILHEPLTRITAVEWNPNPGFGCWAAAALGSGLVRVLDLGLDNDD